MDGKPAPGGKYEWRALQTHGLRSEYLMSIGTSVGDRWWPGNHAGPTAVTVADDSLIVAAHPEVPPLLTRVGFNGRVIWERDALEPRVFKAPLPNGEYLLRYGDDTQATTLVEVQPNGMEACCSSSRPCRCCWCTMSSRTGCARSLALA